MSVIYSKVSMETCDKIVDWADSMGIDYDLNRPEEARYEVGMSQENWDKWDSEKKSTPVEPTPHWDKRLAGVLRERGVSEEHIGIVIGEVAENNQKIHTQAYSRGYEDGYTEGYKQGELHSDLYWNP